MAKRIFSKLIVQSLATTIVVAPVLSVVSMKQSNHESSIVSDRAYTEIDILADIGDTLDGLMTGNAIVRYIRGVAFKQFKKIIQENHLSLIQEFFTDIVAQDPTFDYLSLINDALVATNLPNLRTDGFPFDMNAEADELDDLVIKFMNDNEDGHESNRYSYLFIDYIYTVSRSVPEFSSLINPLIDGWASQKAGEYGLNYGEDSHAIGLKEMVAELEKNAQSIYNTVGFIDSTRPWKKFTTVSNNFRSAFADYWEPAVGKSSFKIKTETEINNRFRSDINQLKDVNGATPNVENTSETFTISQQKEIEALLGGANFDFSEQTHRNSLESVFPGIISTITGYVGHTISPTIVINQKFEKDNDNYGFTTFTFEIGFDTNKVSFTRKVKTFAEISQIEKIKNIITSAFMLQNKWTESDYLSFINNVYIADETLLRFSETEYHIDDNQLFDRYVTIDEPGKRPLSNHISNIDQNAKITWRLTNKSAIAKNETVKIYAEITSKDEEGNESTETVGYNPLSPLRFTIAITDRIIPVNIQSPITNNLVASDMTPKLEKRDYENKTIREILLLTFGNDFTTIETGLADIVTYRKNIESYNSIIQSNPIYTIEYKYKEGWIWGSSDKVTIEYTISDTSYKDVASSVNVQFTGTIQIPINNSVKEYYDWVNQKIINPIIDGNNIDEYTGKDFTIDELNGILSGIKEKIAEANAKNISFTYGTSWATSNKLYVKFTFTNLDNITDTLVLDKLISVDNMATTAEIQEKIDEARDLLDRYVSAVSSIDISDVEQKAIFIEMLNETYREFVESVEGKRITKDFLEARYVEYVTKMDELMMAAIAYQKEEILKELEEIFGSIEDIPQEVLDWLAEDYDRINDLLKMSKDEIEAFMKLIAMLKKFNATALINHLKRLDDVSKGVIVGVAGVASVVSILGGSATLKSLRLNSRLKKAGDSTVVKHKTWLSIGVSLVAIAIAVSLLLFVFITKGGF